MPEIPHQLDDNGFPEFEPVRIYDAPATILTQIYDGEGSLGRAVRTIMSSESLSPAERDSYAQRLKKAHGGNAITDTALDLALNPLTWLVFAVSPIGRREFIKTRGKLLSGLGEMQGTRSGRAFSRIAEMLRPLQATGLLSMGETTATTAIYRALESRLKALAEEEQQIVGTARGNIMKRLGVDDLDPTQITNPELKQKLEELNVLSHMWASGNLRPSRVLYRSSAATHGGVFRNAGGVESPRLLNAAEYKEAIKNRKIIDPATSEELTLVGDPIKVTNAAKLRELRGKFPPGERGNVMYRAIEERLENRFNVSALTEDRVLEWAERNGIRDEFVAYMEANERARQAMKTRLFGKVNPDNTLPPTFELDPDKVIRVFTRWQKSQGKEALTVEEWALDSLLGMEEVNKLLPGWVKQTLRRGGTTVKMDEVRRVVSEVLGPQMEQSYLSRNTFRLYGTGKGGETVRYGPNHTDALMRKRETVGDPLEVSGLYLPRRGEQLQYDPEDLKILRRVVAGEETPASLRAADTTMVTAPGRDPMTLGEYIELTENTIKSASAQKARVVTHAMDHELSMRNYIGDAASTVALHTAEVPQSIRDQVLNAIRVGRRQMQGAEGPPMTLSRSQRQIYAEQGVRAEDLPLMASGSARLPESLEPVPAAAEIRNQLRTLNPDIDALRARLASGTGITPATRIRLEGRLSKMEKKQRALRRRMDRIGRMEGRPDVALLNPEVNAPLSMADAIDVVLGRENLETQEYFRKGILPAMFGAAKPPQLFGLKMSQQARRMARDFAEGAAGKFLSRNGGALGKSVVDNVRAYGNMSGYELDAAHAAGGLTGYLYATHLGFNAVSAMWNLMQPLQWATTWMGGTEILSAYGKAFKQMGSYLAERVKYPMRMDPREQRELMRKHFPLMGNATGGRDLLMWEDDFISTLDSAIFSKPQKGRPSLGKFLLIDMPLKLFQKAEQLNRVVVAEAGMSWMQRLQRESGITVPRNEMLDFVGTMQSIVNFSPNAVTQLRVFQNGGMLGNSLIRMFMQYPSRTLSNFLISAQLGGGTRQVGLQAIGGPSIDVAAPIADAARLLGTGAIAYEIGKNMLGVDLSSGLSGAAVSQLPQQFMTQGIPIPPVVDIPLQLISGLAQQDRDQFRQAMFRVLPAGVQLQKTFGAMPAVPGVGGPFGLVQSQYADWRNPNPEGLVPVYRDDGTLQSYEKPLDLVLRGVGADFKKLKSPMEATKFLLSNRAEIVDLKRKYKDAVLGNNMSAAAAIEAEYKKRYGIPMTVKPSEWDRAMELREVPLFERMTQQLPQDIQGQYQQVLRQPGLLQPENPQESDAARQMEALRRMSAPGSF